MSGDRLNTATMSPITSVPNAVRWIGSPPDVRWSNAMPSTAPAPNKAMSQPNSASLASSTSRTNTMPVENSAPSPSATEAAAGITAIVDRFRTHAPPHVTAPEVHVERVGDVTGAFDADQLEALLAELLSNACKYGRKRPVGVRVEGRIDLVRVVVED